jgi:uncharacterized protein
LHGPLVGSLILGTIWSLWHLPIFFIPIWNNPPTVFNIVVYVLMLTSFTIVVTWVFNNAKGSLLITMLMHATFNAFSGSPLPVLFPEPLVAGHGNNVPLLIGFGVVALVIGAFTRGRLGYEHYLQEGEPDPATARWQGRVFQKPGHRKPNCREHPFSAIT